MRGLVVLCVVLCLAPAAWAQGGNDHIGLYLDVGATECTGVIDGPGQLVVVKVLAVLPDLAAPIIAAEFCLTNLPLSGGTGEGILSVDWNADLQIGDPRTGIALAWTAPQAGPVVELGTLNFYSDAATDWIGPDHLIGVRETVGYHNPVSVVTADGATVLVGGAAFVFNCSNLAQCICWNAAPPLCELSSTALDFGELVVGGQQSQTLALRNAGAQALLGNIAIAESPADFYVIAGGGPFSLAAGEERQIRVSFAPTALGPRSATLSFGGTACPAVPCAGTGVPPVPQCTIACAFTDFDTVAVGDYRSLWVTLGNPGTGNLWLTVPVGQGDFLVGTGAGERIIPPNGYHNLQVHYLPSAPGPASWTLDFGSEYCADLTLTATARESQAICEIDPPSLSFGVVTIGHYSDKPFTLRNLGTDRLLVRAERQCGPFTIRETVAEWLVMAPGAQRTLTLRFEPTLPGEADCAIDLRTAPCAELIAQGSGFGGPACAVSPSVLDFGEVGIGYGRIREFTLTNTGTVPYLCSIPHLLGEFETIAGYGDELLSVDEVHTVSVRFQPTALGPYSAELSFGDSPCSPLQLVGSGREPISACVLSPDTLDFGEVLLGHYLDATLTIVNAGDEGFVCTVPEVGSPFATIAGAGTHPLNGGDSIQVGLRFTPETLDPVSAAYSLGTALCSPLVLRGSGHEGSYACAVQPPEGDFGDVWVDASSPALDFTLWNTGEFPFSGEVTILDGSFSLLSGGGAFTLAGGAGHDLRVRFHPTEHGLQSGTIGFGTPGCPGLPLLGYGWRWLWGTNGIGIFADNAGEVCAQALPAGETLELRILALVPSLDHWGITGAEFRIAGLEALAGLADWSFSWTWPAVAGDPAIGIRFEFPAATGGLVELGRLHLAALQAIPADQLLSIERSLDRSELSVHNQQGIAYDLNGGRFTLNCQDEELCSCFAWNTPVVLSDFSITAEAGLAVLRWATGADLDAEFRLVGAAQGAEWEIAHRQESDGSYRAEDPRWAEQGGVAVHYQLFGRLPGEEWQLLREESLASPAPAGRARLLAPHPNPFNPSVTIPFQLPAPQRLRLLVHDVAGRRVALLADREFPAGEHALVWDGRDESGRPAGSGVYFVRLEAAGVSESQKLVLLR